MPELTGIFISTSTECSVNVRVQMLAELEEIIQYKQNPEEKRLVMRRTWMKRCVRIAIFLTVD
jgi:FAT domain